MMMVKIISVRASFMQWNLTQGPLAIAKIALCLLFRIIMYTSIYMDGNMPL